jgi:arginine/lysine/ornithine decarboxylase
MSRNSAEYMRNYRRTSPAYQAIANNEKAKARKRKYNQSEKGRLANALKKKLRAKQAKEIIEAAKAVPCADCGGIFPRQVLDFHHVEPKAFEIGRSWHRTINTLRAEIAKCVVICANCHRIRHIGQYY